MLLAKSGVKVTIVEKRGGVGGRTSTIEQDGFKFDVGPTFFLYPQVLKEIFAAAGYDLAAEVPMTRLDPAISARLRRRRRIAGNAKPRTDGESHRCDLA